MSLSFEKKANLLSYSGMSCLRNEYAHNNCTSCLDVCPESSLVIERGKFEIRDNCTSCAVCLGSCPTEALKLENFDPNAFVLSLSAKEEKVVSCKVNSECLAAFDTAHYMSMALRNESEVSCDLSHCSSCDMNRGNAISDEIEGKIFLANSYLEQLGLEDKVLVVQEPVEKKQSRFAMFKQAHTSLTQISSETVTQVHAAGLIPLKMVILKNALRDRMRDITQTKLHSTLLFTQQEIDFNKCTNCTECIQFCPTKALFSSEDKQGIMFKGGDCIGCGICHDVCKEDAISVSKELDVVTMAYDRVQELVHYEMAKCLECKCAYPYKGGEQICDRCAQFTTEHDDLFTLARDM
jgi:energy-converting hydrogenase A subunit P